MITNINEVNKFTLLSHYYLAQVCITNINNFPFFINNSFLFSSVITISNQTNLKLPPDINLDQFAWITPLLGNISNECRSASEKYRDALIEVLNSTNLKEKENSPMIPAALQMFDSNGRLPMEGFLSDVLEIPIDLCELVGESTKSCLLPNAVRFIVLKIPLGYSNNPGSHGECLSVEQTETKYCTVRLKGADLGFGGIALPARKSFSRMKSLSEYLYFLHPRLSTMYKADTDFVSVELFQTNDFKNLFGLLSAEGNLTRVEMQELQEQVLLLFVGIYSAVSNPSNGMCFPKSCSPEDINENYKVLTAKSFEDIIIDIMGNPINLLKTGNLTIETKAEDCFTRDNRSGMPEDYPFIVLLIYTIFSLIGCLTVIGTLLDLISPITEDEKIKPQTMKKRILMCFSAYTNGKHLLSTKSSGQDHFNCLNGMRFLSMTWVILGHSFGSSLFTGRNLGEVLNLISGEGGIALEAVLNAFPSVDTFFFMSGSLTSFILFKEVEQADKDKTKHAIVLLLYYVHRYLRITVPYALVMGVIIAVLPYTFYGPSWSFTIKEAEDCSNYGWANLLYIQTFLESTKDSICMEVSWYLVDDMVFHWFSPIVMYPMFIAFLKTKSHIVGMLWWGFTMVCFTGGLFYMSYTTNQPPSRTHMVPGLDEDGYNLYVDFYEAPWVRYQPYLVGILLGYILHHTREKQVKINNAANILLWQAAFLAGFAVVYGLYGVRTQTMTHFSASIYNSFQRLAWSGALAWVIFSCAKGYGGVVNDLLSWSLFAPLARITFCTYLIHTNLLGMFTSSVLLSFPFDFSFWVSVWHFLGSLSISLTVGFFLSMFFESPSVRLEKLLIGSVLQGLIPNSGKHNKD